MIIGITNEELSEVMLGGEVGLAVAFRDVACGGHR